MSSLEEKLQDLIHINLCLLQDNGHKMNFQEGMFRERNLPGFETVGHTLLMIIDKTECTKNIPWPLLDDKSLRAEFRKNFSKFIKMVNSKHLEACIPEVAASTLQFPGGLKFLRFMYRLSTFVLQLELKRIMSPEDAKELLLQPVPSKQAMDNKVKLNIVSGACVEEQQNLQEIQDYLVSAMPLVEKLNNHDGKVQNDLHNVQAELEAKVSGLSVNDAKKKQFLDTEDTAAIEDWDGVTDGKKRELEERVERVLAVRDASTAVSTQLRTAQIARAGPVLYFDRVSMDGQLLGDLTPLVKLAGRAVLNDRGQVRLETVYRAGAEAARRLAASRPPADPSHSPVLPTAQTLLNDTKALHTASSKALAVIHKMDQDNEKVIAELRPIIYERVKGSVVPDHFKYLKPRKVTEFAKPSFSMKKEQRRRRSGNWLRLLDVLKKGHSRKNYNCSYKRRYEAVSSRITSTVRGSLSVIPRFPMTASRVSLGTSRKPFSPPKIPHATTAAKRTRRLQETPSTYTAGPEVLCRRSLYRNLPTGEKPKTNQILSPEEGSFSEQSFSNFEDCFLAPVEENNLASLLPIGAEPITPPISSLVPSDLENSSPIRNESDVTLLKTPQHKAGRKSIDALIERFRKVRQSMSITQEKLS